MSGGEEARSSCGEPIPPGMLKYHEAMGRLLLEISRNYFQNPKLYDRGHVLCPMCGCRLSRWEETFNT
jgi:hypothetical protein